MIGNNELSNCVNIDNNLTNNNLTSNIDHNLTNDC